MKIGFFELEGWEDDLIRQGLDGEEFQLVLAKDKLDPDSPPPESDLEALSIFVNSRITKEILASFPQLRFITTRSTGFDHIDLEACREKNVVVSFVPGYGDNTVAEFAFSLILNLTRRTYQAIDQIKETRSFSLAGLRGTDLKEKTLGVVGTGRIGREVVKIAKGFGMHVVACDLHPDKAFQEKIGFEYASLEDLLKNSDIVTLHAPYNEKTRHLINKKNIALMKNGAYIVNTARGGLIETKALVDALTSGRLGGAALDVLEEEGEVKDELKFLKNPHPRQEELKILLYDHILMKLSNVLITPHNAFNSQEAIERILTTTLDNIKSFKKNQPINLVKQ